MYSLSLCDVKAIHALKIVKSEARKIHCIYKLFQLLQITLSPGGQLRSAFVLQ